MKNIRFYFILLYVSFFIHLSAFAGDSIFALPKIAFIPFASGFSRITDITNAGDGRLFVTEQAGKIKIVQPNGTVNQKLFLNISSIVNSSGNSQGLLGMAFHPSYSSNKYFFLNYTKKSDSSNTQISRFSTSLVNADTALLSSKSEILYFTQLNKFHNGGDLNFSTDGYLYIGTGDGGKPTETSNNAQNNKLLLGKLLRIDINNAAPYSIPATNPFVGNSNYLPEIWATGLRNPWRISFDKQTNDLWIADAGQNDWEEVNMVQSGSNGGMNFGWKCWEGNHQYDTTGCFAQQNLQFPIFEYEQSDPQCSIIGGFVYRGKQYPRLFGQYICTDYCSGDVWLVKKQNNQTSSFRKSSGSLTAIVTFGENNMGELFAGNGDNGKIYKVIDTCTHFYAVKNIQQACNGNNGSISLNIIGGIGNKTILWSNGNNTINNTNLSPNIYYLSITDQQGCEIIDTTNIIAVAPEVPTIQFNIENNILSTSTATNYQWFKDGIPYLIQSVAQTDSTTIATVSGDYYVKTIDKNGCEAQSETLAIVISKLENEINIGSLSLFPNPAKNFIHIQFNGNNNQSNQLLVMDVFGKKIIEIDFKNQSTNLDISQLSTGFYFVKIITDKGAISKKIFKQ